VKAAANLRCIAASAALGVVLPAACLLAGCGILKMPDMSRTSGIARLRKPQHPLILIPGFLGTKLRDPETGQVLWGTMANILSHDHSARLACPLEEESGAAEVRDLEPFALYDSLWGYDYYRKTLRILREAGGYQLGDMKHPKPGDNAFIFVYDWRKDIAESAAGLAGAVDHLKKTLGNPALKFDILGHSQGGLIARYYAKYGGSDVLAGDGPPVPDGSGAANLNKVILLGTPNRGSLEVLKILHQGLKKVFLPMPPSVTFTMPSLYEMLPPPDDSLFADLDGRAIPLDLYDPETWVREKLSLFSQEEQDQLRRKLERAGMGPRVLEMENRRMEAFLERSLRRARRFQEALARPAPEGTDVAYYAFGSDCIPTLKTAVILNGKGGHRIFFEPGRLHDEATGEKMRRVLYGPGDGTVLMESLLDLPEMAPEHSASLRPGSVNLTSAFFVCESHGLLPNDPIFQNNLFYLLLYERDPPATTARTSGPTSAGF
jgi:pimeloyl-ACP methyl ester carboxylesterase